MRDKGITRRSFLITSSAGLSTAWLAASWPEIRAAQEHAHRSSTTALPAKFEFFSDADAAEVEAMAAQVLPSDGAPGAREARVIYFIDRALVTFDRSKRRLYRRGLIGLRAKTRRQFPAVAKFSDLTAAQQIELLKSIEKTPFFESVRIHTVMGFFANPEWGGNRDGVGWKLIGNRSNRDPNERVLKNDKT